MQCHQAVGSVSIEIDSRVKPFLPSLPCRLGNPFLPDHNVIRAYESKAGFFGGHCHANHSPAHDRRAYVPRMLWLSIVPVKNSIWNWTYWQHIKGALSRSHLNTYPNSQIPFNSLTIFNKLSKTSQPHRQLDLPAISLADMKLLNFFFAALFALPGE